MASNYDDLIDAAARAENVDPQWMKSIFMQESSGGVNVGKSLPNDPDSPVGPVQMRPSTARGLGIQDPSNPAQAFVGLARYLKQGLDFKNTPDGYTPGTPEAATAHYFAGPDPSGWGPKTAKYVAEVSARYPTMVVQPSGSAAATAPDPAAALLSKFRAQQAGASPSSVDPDVAAGMAYHSTTTAPASADPDVAAGQAFYQKQLAALPAPKPAAEPNPAVTGGVDDMGRSLDPTQATQGLAAPAAVGIDALRRVASAAGQGAVAGAGSGPLTLSPETANQLRRLGITPPVDGSGTLLQRLNEGGINALAPPVNAVVRGIGGLIGGYQGGVAQAGAEIGQPQLGRDLAALPEAFPTGFDAGVPRPAAMPANRLAATPDAPLPRLAGPAQTVDAVPANRLAAAPAPAPVGAIGGWRPMQPGEPLSLGQAVATDAAGQNYVRSGGDAPSGASPAPNSVGAAATTPGEGVAMTPQEALAARTQGERNRFNTPPRGQDTTTYVAGTQPTLAEVAGSPEAAFQQKQVSQNPLTMDALTKQMQRNNDARVLHYEDIAGSEPELQRMVAARSAQADADLQAAFANRKPTDTTDAVKTINDILADPRVAPRDQITSPVRGILDKMTDADGNPITDPLALYGVREHITDMLSKPSMGRDPTVANARPQLVEIKNALDDAIEKGAPGFAKYRENYTNASNPIDAMQFLQQARAGLTNQAGQFQAAKYNNLMKNIVEDRATGDTTLPASKLTDDQMNALFNLHADTKRMGNIDLSNPRGSDTNMLGQAARMAGLAALHGAAGYVAPVVGNIGIQMGKTAFQQRQANRLLQGVLNPDPVKYPPNTLN